MKFGVNDGGGNGARCGGIQRSCLIASFGDIILKNFIINIHETVVPANRSICLL